MIIFNHYILIFCYNRDVHWRASFDMLGAGLLRISFQSLLLYYVRGQDHKISLYNFDKHDLQK